MGDIRTWLLQQADKPSDRRQDIIHPSEMASHEWCPRRSYYRIRDVRAGKPYKGEGRSVGALSIFEEGHAIHAKYQGWLRAMGRLKGRWDCRECEKRGVAFGEDPVHCPECGSKIGVVYGEVPLDASKELLIAGHSDGWVDSSLIEIKSIGLGTIRIDAPELVRQHTHAIASGKTIVDVNGLWDAINRPLPAHNRQGNIYLHLAKLLGIQVETMTYLYESKANQQTKEFTVRAVPFIINPLLEKAETVRDALSKPDGPPPPRAFSDPEKRPCKNCEFLKECYASDSAKPKSSFSESGGEERSEGSGANREPRRPTRPMRRSSPASEGHHGAGRSGSDDPLRRVGRVGRVPRRKARGIGDS